MHYLVFVFCCLGTYFLCGIPFGKIFASASGIDITKVGSKNIGMTNVARACSLYQAILTLLCDILKGFLSIYFSLWLLAAYGGISPQDLLYPGSFDWMISWLYLVAISGHIFSPYLKFKGGKGIAVGFGAAVAFSYQIAFGLLVVWIIAMCFARFVSLGSILAAFSLPWLAICFYFPPQPLFIAPFFIISFLVIWAHRQNVARLKAGTESKFSVAKKKEAKDG